MKQQSEKEILEKVIAKLPDAKSYPENIITVPHTVKWINKDPDVLTGKFHFEEIETQFRISFIKSNCGQYWIAPKSFTEKFDFELENLLK